MNWQNKRPLVGVLAALVVALPGFAVAENAADDVDVDLTTHRYGQVMLDVNGESVRRAALTVTNHAAADIVMVVVKARDAQFATLQDPMPVGWSAIWTRTTVEFTGLLVEDSMQVFPVRLLADGMTDSAAFEIDVITADLSVAPAPLQLNLEQVTSSKYACQVLTMTRVGADDEGTFLPVTTLSNTVRTEAFALVAVYDLVHRTYVEPSAVRGTLSIQARGLAPSQVVPLAGELRAPYLDAAGGPVLDTRGEGPGVAAAVAPLFGADLASRVGYAGAYGFMTLTAVASVANGSGCGPTPFSLARAVSPLAPAVAAPFVIVPPELDSDLDGYANLAELRSNSNPLRLDSGPYSDDDDDGIENARDLVSFFNPDSV